MSEQRATEVAAIRACAATLRRASPDDGWAMRLIADGLDNDASEHEAGRLSETMLAAALDVAESFEPTP